MPDFSSIGWFFESEAFIMSPVVPMSIKEMYKGHKVDTDAPLSGVPPDDVHEIIYWTKKQIGPDKFYQL